MVVPHLQEVFEHAEPGTEFVITLSRYNQNLQPLFNKIIRRAGLQPWPKLFQNLRRTREAELAETHLLHVVCAWIGNSRAVTIQHDLQATNDHFKAAEKTTTKAVHNPAQQPAATRRS